MGVCGGGYVGLTLLIHRPLCGVRQLKTCNGERTSYSGGIGVVCLTSKHHPTELKTGSCPQPWEDPPTPRKAFRCTVQHERPVLPCDDQNFAVCREFKGDHGLNLAVCFKLSSDGLLTPGITGILRLQVLHRQLRGLTMINPAAVRNCRDCRGY